MGVVLVFILYLGGAQREANQGVDDEVQGRELSIKGDDEVGEGGKLVRFIAVLHSNGLRGETDPRWQNLLGWAVEDTEGSREPECGELPLLGDGHLGIHTFLLWGFPEEGFAGARYEKCITGGKGGIILLGKWRQVW